MAKKFRSSFPEEGVFALGGEGRYHVRSFGRGSFKPPLLPPSAAHARGAEDVGMGGSGR